MTGAENSITIVVPRPGFGPVGVELTASRIAGRYQVVRELGRGGMGVVYEAVDTDTGLTRAIKVGLLDRYDPVLLERMAHEATMLMFLRHPNLVVVHDMGTDRAHRLHYEVMDYAPGGCLGTRRDQHGPLTVSEVAGVGVQLACVLDLLHARRIVHRDVKPTNLLLDGKGRMLLTDLGISKLPDAEVELTNDDQVMGSFPFMAPEQLTEIGNLTPAGDVYAVGTTLFNLATAKSPVHLFAAHDDNKRWQALPEALRPTVRRATMLQQEQRYPSAWELGRELAPLAPPELLDEQPHLATWLEERHGTPSSVERRGHEVEHPGEGHLP